MVVPGEQGLWARGVVWWVVLDNPGCGFVEFAGETVEGGVVFVVDLAGAGEDGVDVVPDRIRRHRP
ncbi:hypothetical protein ACFW61_35405, partial [Streptomyces microflavus]|uniref:hypothetical protein n=1 Tax=Streptomyces microflavus TaxID=1919 RepID=UPI003679D34A